MPEGIYLKGAIYEVMAGTRHRLQFEKGAAAASKAEMLTVVVAIGVSLPSARNKQPPRLMSRMAPSKRLSTAARAAGMVQE
jgi:hypothetical protein